MFKRISALVLGAVVALSLGATSASARPPKVSPGKICIVLDWKDANGQPIVLCFNSPSPTRLPVGKATVHDGGGWQS